MKRNAIIRMILWSLVIVILSSILLVFMGIRYGIVGDKIFSRTTVETAPAILMTTPNEENTLIFEGYVSEPVNIRSSPSTQASTVGMLDTGTKVTISLQENVDGIDWAFITSPETGWVVSEYLHASDYPAEETAYFDSTEDKDTFSGNEISELEIEWVAGEILIEPGVSDQITVKEDGVSDPKYAMVLKKTGNTLKIQFCDEAVGKYFGINTRSDISKDLTIIVPPDWICESLEIDAASATVEINDMTIQEVDFDGASGKCEFENCTVEEFDIDTASGDVRYIGKLEILDCDAASADIYAVLTNVPRRLDMDTMSGDLEITLPKDAGFTLSMDTLNNHFNSEFETYQKNGNYVCGDGHCRINIDALSGDVTLHQAEQ